jgi:hypothetical protein
MYHTQERGTYNVSVGNPQGKRPPGTPRCKWVNIKMDLKEIGWSVDGFMIGCSSWLL